MLLLSFPNEHHLEQTQSVPWLCWPWASSAAELAVLHPSQTFSLVLVLNTDGKLSLSYFTGILCDQRMLPE